MIQHLERSMTKQWQKRAERIAERRQQDVKDEAQDCLMTMGEHGLSSGDHSRLPQQSYTNFPCDIESIAICHNGISDKNKAIDPSTQSEDKLRRFAEREARR